MNTKLIQTYYGVDFLVIHGDHNHTIDDVNTAAEA